LEPTNVILPIFESYFCDRLTLAHFTPHRGVKWAIGIIICFTRIDVLDVE